LFQSQDLWLAHRQSHRNAPNPPQNPPQNQARVDLEHSYRKPEEESGQNAAETGAETAAEPPGDAGAVQLLLYECGECLQLFQSPKDFLEHQVTHLAPAPAP
ncbi:ZN574 protein, partial [Chloropsis hardwickii]|nr:ZN574 protein [Chloropsis hardwickii]